MREEVIRLFFAGVRVRGVGVGVGIGMGEVVGAGDEGDVPGGGGVRGEGGVFVGCSFCCLFVHLFVC